MGSAAMAGALAAQTIPAPPRTPPLQGAHELIDLASDSDWTLRLDDGPERPIKVPGAGWNSDQQSPRIQVMREVKDFVRYKRTITVPASAADRAVQLRFGAVAYGCEIFLDGKKAGEHHGPLVPFTVDLTPFAIPGKPQTLEVKAYHRRHYIAKDSTRTAEVAVGFDCPDGDDEASRAEAQEWCGWRGNTKFGYGIVRSLELAVLPAVRVQEAFVRTSVSRQTLECDIWLRNDSAKPREVTLRGAFSSWNQRDWKYPSVAPVPATVPAHSTVKVSLSPVEWKLGEESYWWPNIPFREDYLAQLHFLNLEVNEGGRLLQTYPQRFGFVEHGEGPHYYTVNGIRVNGISDATAESQLSFFDAYSSPAWLPPTAPGTGAPESWRRYMRVGINTNRLLCSPPTEYMMEAADEVGFLLVPEAPIWGNGMSRYSPRYTPQTYHDLGRACRNHPSVARYSLANEVREKRDAHWPWRAAIDHIREVDDTRPLTFEMHSQGSGKVEGFKGGHAWIMEHYTDIHERVDPENGIRGMGENFWHVNMGNFAVGIRTLRANGWCYMSGWSWTNYWPNFLEGMSHDLHAWKLNNHPDRKDGIDGWGSPIVQFTQQSLHPYLLQDLGLLAENPGAPVDAGGNGRIRWPYDLPVCVAGTPVERSIAVFNGGLKGNALALRWSLRWDKPEGPVAVAGDDVALAIEPGFHATRKIAFVAPTLEEGRDERHLYLVMESIKDGQTVFRDNSVCLRVLAKEPPTASALFLGTDNATRGNWRNKYGAEGHELPGKVSAMPAPRKFQWSKGEIVIHEKRTEDLRAPEFFQNDMPSTPRDRIAAGRYGNEIAFTLDAGATPRRLSLYCVDRDAKNRIQELEVRDATRSVALDKQTLADFADGRYQTWRVQGKIQVVIRPVQGGDATVSAVFLDPDKPGATHP
jgi:hypothetical protein